MDRIKRLDRLTAKASKLYLARGTDSAWLRFARLDAEHNRLVRVWYWQGA